VLNRSSGIFSSFGAEKPPLRQAAGRCRKPVSDTNRTKKPQKKHSGFLLKKQHLTTFSHQLK